MKITHGKRQSTYGTGRNLSLMVITRLIFSSGEFILSFQTNLAFGAKQSRTNNKTITEARGQGIKYWRLRITRY